jgi:hypothetical protein
MPIYEYECEKCNTVFEAMQSISSKPLKKCNKFLPLGLFLKDPVGSRQNTHQMLEKKAGSLKVRALKLMPTRILQVKQLMPIKILREINRAT